MADEVKVHRNAEGGLRRVMEVFLVALRLGLTSFGGPIAHLGYYREEYVARRKWLDEHTYADIVAMCQVLPGPASSQVSISIGIMRAGLLSAGEGRSYAPARPKRWGMPQQPPSSPDMSGLLFVTCCGCGVIA